MNVNIFLDKLEMRRLLRYQLVSHQLFHSWIVYLPSDVLKVLRFGIWP